MLGIPAKSDRSLAADQRAVSAVIGALLILALVMLLLSILQAVAIPALNAQHEFQHDQAVQDDVLTLESDLDRVAATGVGATAIVDIGFRYPPRLLFINPPPAEGTLRTTEAESVRIANATAPGETGQYWDGDPITFPTTALVYEPGYNEYDGAPETVLEPWAVYNRFDEAVIPLSDTDLIDGRVISLVALDGEYRRQTADSAAIDIRPTSAPVRTVTVSNDTSPITITVPTQLPRDAWDELLADELDPTSTEPNRYVRAIRCEPDPPTPCGEVTIVLEPGSYDLRLGEVSVGRNASSEGPAYLTDIRGNGSSVPAGGTQRLVVEARDRFDNPVSGVPVTASLSTGNGTIEQLTVTTDADGRAVFRYQAPVNISGIHPVEIEAQFGESPEQAVTFGLTVTGQGGGPTPPGENGTDGGVDPPASASLVDFMGPVETRNIPGGDRGRVVTFQATADAPVIITGIQVTTQDELATREFDEQGTTIAGEELANLPIAVSGAFEIALRDVPASRNVDISEIVSPTDPGADLIVVIEFADGSTVSVGLD